MAEMSDSDKQRARDLLDRLESDDVQRALKPGFQRDFANSVLDQFARKEWLSDRQLEILEDIVTQAEAPRSTGSFSRRRYEGR